ncbi:hypothetical protein ACEQ8H_001744 [Pleosporales sp. CAS-2024a]
MAGNAVQAPPDLCRVPARPPPAGQVSDFVNPVSLAPAKIAVISILLLWASIFTAGRFYVNLRKLTKADYFALVSLLISITILGLMCSETRSDRHMWDIPACFIDGKFSRMVFFFPGILFNAGSFFAKASIFLLFHQIFTIQKTTRIAIKIGHVFNFLIYAVGFATAIVYEAPRPGESWAAILDGRLMIPLHWWQAQAGLVVVLDIYIFVLPLPNLWKLQVPLRRRIPALAVFSLALMGIGASIASLIERIFIGTVLDQTWISSILSLCSAVELNVAIIVSSGPGFASFTRRHVPALSSIAGSFFSSDNKVNDSEIALARGNDKHAHLDKTPTPTIGSGGEDRRFRQNQFNDVWFLKSSATADEAMLTAKDARILRTIEVDQSVKKASLASTSTKSSLTQSHVVTMAQ